MRILGVLLVIWLVIGAIAAGQRHYYSKDAATSCASASTIAVTIAAGPLNYFGVNPRVNCKLPQPSK